MRVVNMSNRIRGIQESDRYENAKISKTLKYFLILLLTFFMLDFGYKFKYKKINIAIRHIIFVVSSLGAFMLLVVTILDLYTFNHVFSYLYLAQYLLNIYILLYCDQKNSLYDILENLYFIDFQVYFQNAYKIERVLFSAIFFSFITNISVNVLFCKYFSFQTTVGECSLISTLAIGLNFPLLLNFFLFYSIYCRLKKLRDVVQNNCLNIVSCQFLYKFLIDSTEKGKKVYDFLVSFFWIVLASKQIFLG